MAVQWGTVGEWLSGVGTIGATVLALLVVWREGRQRRAEVLRVAFLEASAVTVAPDLGAQIGLWKVVNNSGTIVRSVTVTGVLPNGYGQAPRSALPILEPGTAGTCSAVGADQPKSWLVPHDGGAFLANLSYVGWYIDFADEVGRQWRSFGPSVYLRRRGGWVDRTGERVAMAALEPPNGIRPFVQRQRPSPRGTPSENS